MVSICISLQQPKPVLLKLQQPLVPHFAQLVGHGAAVYGQKVCQLLPVKGNSEAAATVSLGLLRKIGDQLLPGGTAGHVSQFLHQLPILLGNREEEILHHRRVEAAGVGAGGDDPAHIEENDGAILGSDHICQQGTAFRGEIPFAKQIANANIMDNAAVAPVVILLHMELSPFVIFPSLTMTLPFICQFTSVRASIAAGRLISVCATGISPNSRLNAKISASDISTVCGVHMNIFDR